MTNPTALLWLGLIVPVVIFYVLKVRLRRVPVSTILFWRQIYNEHQPRSLWRRWRHRLSLLVQILLVCLLVLALTDPHFAWEVRQARRSVLIVDNSASMTATDVTPSRLAQAKDSANLLIGAMRFGDEIAVVTAGGRPQVTCGFSSRSRRLVSTVDGIAATDSPTHVADAVELARRLLGQRDDEHRREILVLTDGGLDTARREGSSVAPNNQATERDQPELLVRRFGTSSAGNVGITRFQVRRSLIDPLGYEILVEVTNLSDEPIETRLEIDLNQDLVDVVPLQLAPGQCWSQTLEKTSADGGVLVAKLDHADPLAADNSAWAVLPRRDPLSVTLVTEGNLFLQKVFESHPLVRLTNVEPAAWKPEIGSTLTVFHRFVPKRLPAGSVLFIDPRASCDLWQVGESLPNLIVGRQASDSPLMAHVRLDNVLMPEARQLTLASTDGVHVLAASVSGDPLLLTIERSGTKSLVLTVNLDEGDLPLRTAFPILMANALTWFTDSRGELREALSTGTTTQVQLPALRNSVSGDTPSKFVGTHDQRLWLQAPDGRRQPLPHNIERLTLGPFDQCGLWSLVAAPPGKAELNLGKSSEPVATVLLELACNLANRTESELRLKNFEMTNGSTAPLRTTSWDNRPVWFVLVLLAWLLLALEWWAYQRRWIA